MQVCCLRPVFPFATHRAGVTVGPPTMSRREVSTVPPEVCCFRPVFPSVTHRVWVGPPTVSQHEVSTVQVCCLQPVFPPVSHRAAGLGRPQVSRLLEPRVWPALPLSPTRPGRCHSHADSDMNIPSGRSVRQPRPALGPGCTLLLVHY